MMTLLVGVVQTPTATRRRAPLLKPSASAKWPPNAAHSRSSTLWETALLLALDNCEHLIKLSAQLAVELLSHCPHLQILATSREPLNIPGEILWQTPALSLPDLQQLP
ncbi:MAG: hypothetical protein WAU00_04390 [Caldilinea sp.]